MILHVVHGHEKFQIVVPDDDNDTREPNKSDHTGWTILRLKQEIEQLTQVPPENQRIIHRGKSFFDDTSLISSLGFKDGDKVMVLGRKVNSTPAPVIDKTMKELSDFQSQKGNKLLEKLSEISQEIDGISKGFLPENLRDEALAKLDKRLKGVHEECMKALEYIDGINLTAEPESAAHSQQRAKRKSLVQSIQDCLKQHDELNEKVQELIEVSGGTDY